MTVAVGGGRGGRPLLDVRFRGSRIGGPQTGETDGEGLMGFIVWVLFVVVWIALAFWPARVAGRKGHSFLGYFVLSLIFWPLALVLAYVVEDRGRAALLDAPPPNFGPDPTQGL